MRWKREDDKKKKVNSAAIRRGSVSNSETQGRKVEEQIQEKREVKQQKKNFNSR